MKRLTGLPLCEMMGGQSGDGRRKKGHRSDGVVDVEESSGAALLNFLLSRPARICPAASGTTLSSTMGILRLLRSIYEVFGMTRSFQAVRS